MLEKFLVYGAGTAQGSIMASWPWLKGAAQ